MLKTANKQYSTLKNDYEMTMTDDTYLLLCHENNDTIPMQQFNFCPINWIKNKEQNDMIGNVLIKDNYYQISNISITNDLFILKFVLCPLITFM